MASDFAFEQKKIKIVSVARELKQKHNMNCFRKKCLKFYFKEEKNKCRRKNVEEKQRDELSKVCAHPNM